MAELELEQLMLAEARTEVGVADHKASMVLTALGIGFGALLAGLIAGDWDPSSLSQGSEVVWWIGAGLAASSVCAAAFAVWPRWDSSDYREGIHYWGHVARFETFEALNEALDKNQVDNLSRTRHQLWQLSEIVERKYRYVRRAFALAALAVLPLLVSVIAG